MKITKQSKIGQYHTSIGKECQDRVFFQENQNYAIAAIADGATACPKSGTGAEITCHAIWDFVQREKDRVFTFPEEKLSYLLIEHILYFLEKETGLPEQMIQADYASTFAAACMEKKTGKTMLLNLGDGAVFSISGNALREELSPKRFHGQPCLTTTSRAQKAVETKRTDVLPGDALLLCTDGFLNLLSRTREQGEAMRETICSADFQKLQSCFDGVQGKDDSSYIMLQR